MSDRVEDYGYLWADPSGDWALLRFGPDNDRFLIFNKKGSVLLVELDDLNAAICARMLEAGCQVLDEMPPLGPAEVKPIDE